MNKLESALRRCRKFYQTYEKQVRIAVITIVVITALLLFGGNGENEEIVVEQSGETETELSVDGQSSSEEETSEPAQTPATNLVVDISGCVKNPGVYEVSDGTRLHQVIDAAGGLTEEADIDVINQAELVTDGQKVLIPAKVSAEEFVENTGAGTV
ncbi:MAG: SLBB domain-containing protein, partial [Firmicutes bacterium]|nr:SLBB domain-containing protein [Bacillota bacterium]